MQYRIRAGRQVISVSENLLDRAIRFFDPVRARSRMAARLQLEAATSHTGASRSKRSLSKFLPGGGSADADLLPEIAELRERSRDLVRNAPLAAGALNTVAANVVGTGLMPKCKPVRAILGWTEERAAAWKQQVEQEFALWAECADCDITRTQTFYGLQDLAFRSALENGDVLALLPMRERPAVRYRLAVQLIEADRVSNANRKMDTPTLAGGVRLDADGAPIAYQIQDGHPGDLRRVPLKWIEVPAFGAESGRRNVLHLYGKRRVGQTRGAPYFTPVIEAFKQLDRYTEAEIFAAVANAVFAVKIKTPDKTGLSPLETATTGIAPASGTSDARDASWDGTLTPGLVVDLGEGEDVESVNAGRPNAEFDPFVQAVLRQVGVALELPFEVLVKHFTASYSAARSALLEAWKFYRNRRAWLAEGFCQPVFETWLDEAVARGFVDAPGYFADPLLRYAYTYATWHGDGPGSIDPFKEAQAVAKRLEIHLRTLDQEIAEDSGGDAVSTIEQAGREKELLVAHGLTPAGTVAPAGAAQPPMQDGGNDEERGDREDEAGYRAIAESMNELAAAIVKQPAPVINIAPAPVINIAPAPVTAQVHVPEHITHSVKHDYDVPGLKPLVESVERSVRASHTLARQVEETSRAVEAGLNGVARELGRARKAVLDKDGNVIGSVPVEKLEA